MTQVLSFQTQRGGTGTTTSLSREGRAMSDQLYPAVLLFGTPGVGKGTQGKLLGKIRGIFHLSTGDIFRSLTDDTDERRLVVDCLKRGQLVPDDLTITIWKHWLDAHIQSQEFRPTEDVLLLDGIPRNVRQCERLTRHIHVLQVIHLASSSDEPIIQRLRQRALIEGRSDDADETIIRQRFEVYRRETSPVLRFYPPEIIHEVDPMGTPAEVLKRVLECLIPVMVSLRGSTGSFDGDEITPDDAE
ncbi:MAG TPA: nucleoside monophosphate kinase [Planctomycetaceae bacterium]|nr:nucleoside monophosphate kinase [Planctomycetaceae bacterium]